MTDLTAVVHDANEVAIVRDGTLDTIENGAIAVVEGKVAAVGPTDTVTSEYPPENASHTIDAADRAVIPGFVDGHTHALFAGDRSDEFAAKLRGKPYQEILAEGGGILRTVRATRAASDDTLLDNVLRHLDVMLEHGTTTVEVKSGYGLDTGTELQMLDVIDRADEHHPVDVVPTFMGAHAVPEDEESTDDYVDRVVEDQLPAVESQGIAEFCDVFCEEDVFSVEQSRQVLEAGLDRDLTPKVHAEELSHLGGSQLAADVGAASADHLLHAAEDDIDALRDADVTPVLLPGTAFGLGAEYADARAFLESNTPVAIATDFNPNCHSESMAFAVALACVEMEMTPAEALVGATATGAASIDRDGLGTLAEGTPADLAVLDAPSHVHISYSYGVNRVDTVLKAGEPVVRGGDVL